MSAASALAAGWRCGHCSIIAELEYRDPPSVDTHCVQCHEVANPCAQLRVQVGQLQGELRAIRAEGAKPEPAAVPASDSLTPEEAVAYLRLPSVRALYQAIRRGQVPVHRVGRRMRFQRAELDAVLARR